MRASNLLLVVGALWLMACENGSSGGGDALPLGDADASTGPDADEPGDASEPEIDGSDEIDGPDSEGDGDLGGADTEVPEPDAGDAGEGDDTPAPELAYLCGFRGDPALPEAVLATGGFGPKPSIASPQTRDAWLLGDRVLSQAKGTAIGNELAYIRGAFVLWSADTGLQLTHADEGPLAAAADAFLTFGYDLTSDARRIDNSEFLRLRALSDGTVIRTFSVPNARNLNGAQGGLATDASYAWLRSEYDIMVFERGGTLHTIAGSYLDSVIYSAPDSLWVGSGPAAPEVVRMSLDGTVSFTTSGVIGKFVTWAQDGLHFVTAEPGNLLRVYTREGVLALGPLDGCGLHYLRADLFACWKYTVGDNATLTLYDLANAGAPLDTLTKAEGAEAALVTLDGYLLRERTIRLSQRSIEELEAQESPDEAWWDGVYVRVRRGGTIRSFGCGANVGAQVSGDRVAFITDDGTFLYDTSSGHFERFVGRQRMFAGLSAEGTRMMTSDRGSPTYRVYQLAPTLSQVAEFVPPPGPWITRLSASGEYMGRSERSAIGSWEVLKLPELTVAASGTGAGASLFLSPSATSVATQESLSTPPILLYRNGALTGSVDEEFIDGWLSDTQPVLGDRVLNMDGSVAATARCSSAPPPAVTSNNGFQALSATDYYLRGRMCTIAAGSDPPAEVRPRYLAFPVGMTGDLGIYIPGRAGSSYFAVAPWRQ